MNNNNVIYYEKSGRLYACWNDLSSDDTDAGFCIEASVDGSDSAENRKNVKALLCGAYDEWVRETRF